MPPCDIAEFLRTIPCESAVTVFSLLSRHRADEVLALLGAKRRHTTAEAGKAYLATDVFAIWRKRIPWLLLLMVSATFTSAIISSFEAKLVAFPALTAFIPMLMDTGGNAGGQSSVTIIRGLAVGDVNPSDWPKIISKELRVAILCGITLGVCNFAKILLVDRLLLGQSEITLAVALVISLTLLIAVMAAKLVGCALPLLAKTVRLDPAVMASPFVTTTVDAVALLAYFKIAATFLQI